MVVYLSHTLGGEAADLWTRGNHAANAHDWLRFLVDVTDWAIVMPWQTFVTAIGELQRPRTISDQMQILKRCDAIAFAGGSISPHMAHELKVATEHGIAVIDLTDLGYYPPNLDRIVNLIEARVDLALEVAQKNIRARHPEVRVPQR